MPPLLADFIHARGCKLICAKLLTLPIKTMERIDLTIRSTVFFCYSGEGFARKENIAIAQTAY